jgi:hypothetical protein
VLEGNDGVVGAAELGEGDGEVVVGVGQVGSGLDGLLQEGEGVGGSSGLAVEDGESDEGVGMAWVESEGALEVLGSGVALSSSGEDVAEACVDVGGGRAEAEELGVGVGGHFEFALGLMAEGEGVPGLGVVGLGLDDAPVEVPGGAEVA